MPLTGIALDAPAQILSLAAAMIAGPKSGTAPLPSPDAGYRIEACATPAGSPDDDRDGLSNDCETALAREFAPELLVDPKDCALSGGAAPRLAGAYFYVVQPIDAAGVVVRIAYLPAYYHDCGWRGVQRLLRLGRSNAHAGDSELIVLEVRRDEAMGWRAAGVFLSAHCLGRSDGRCRWFRGRNLGELAWVAESGGAPRVWVGRDKHANYPSRERCESGHWYQERCGRSPVRYRFPVERPEQNIGSRSWSRGDRQGCVSAEQLPLRMAGADPGTTECLWDGERPFRGWQDGPGAASPYGAGIAPSGGALASNEGVSTLSRDATRIDMKRLIVLLLVLDLSNGTALLAQSTEPRATEVQLSAGATTQDRSYRAKVGMALRVALTHRITPRLSAGAGLSQEAFDDMPSGVVCAPGEPCPVDPPGQISMQALSGELAWELARAPRAYVLAGGGSTRARIDRTTTTHPHLTAGAGLVFGGAPVRPFLEIRFTRYIRSETPMSVWTVPVLFGLRF